MEDRYTLELDKVRDNNPGYTIRECFDSSFLSYGRVFSDIDLTPMISTAERLAIPADGVSYCASVPELEASSDFKKLKTLLDANLQAGICSGHNLKLPALEYHKSGEIIPAVTSCLLTLGKTSQIRNFSYSTDQIEIFYIPRGTTVELYKKTLHFAPIQTNKEGFSSIIILPRGTNLDFEGEIPKETDEDTMLFKQNKWILATADSKPAFNGAHVGLVGKMLELKV